MSILFRAYSILGVHPESSDIEIKSRHRILSQMWHPDRADGDKERFIEIQEAFRLIKGPEARKLLRTRLQGLGRGCDPCGSRGFTRSGRGFNKLNKAVCQNCGGCGFVEREQP